MTARRSLTPRTAGRALLHFFSLSGNRRRFIMVIVMPSELVVFPAPVVPAGVVPFDIDAWKARREKRTTEVAKTEAVPIHDQGDDAEWLEWYLKTNEQPVMSNDDLRALAVAKGKPIAPGTMLQHDQYIAEKDKRGHADIIRQYRQFAIFGLWADGSKTGPALAAMDAHTMKWIIGQGQFTKYLKWYRAVDPAGFAAWVEVHPSYRSQAGLPPLPVVLEVNRAA